LIKGDNEEEKVIEINEKHKNMFIGKDRIFGILLIEKNNILNINYF